MKRNRRKRNRRLILLAIFLFAAGAFAAPPSIPCPKAVVCDPTGWCSMQPYITDWGFGHQYPPQGKNITYNFSSAQYNTSQGGTCVYYTTDGVGPVVLDNMTQNTGAHKLYPYTQSGTWFSYSNSLYCYAVNNDPNSCLFYYLLK